MKDIFEWIGVTPRMREAMDRVPMTKEAYEQYKKQMKADPEAFYTEASRGPDARLTFLYLYLHFAKDAYQEYQERKIADEIYVDTMRDIVVWAKNCERDFGECGLAQYDWPWRHVTLRLFQLGRLQYEIVDMKETKEFNGKMEQAGDRILNLHIPQGDPLTREACKKSLQKARMFFTRYKEITCHSWLLNPRMNEILPEESNIVRFQKLFEIYRLDPEARESEERVFLKLEENPGDYPEDTRLQKNLKRYLLSGKRFGSAYGKLLEETLLSG